MQQITNIDTYKTEMQKSMEDKIVFIKKFLPEIKYLVDFGCADGTWLKTATKGSEINCIGIDMNYEMIKAARKNIPIATFILGVMPSVSSNFSYNQAGLNLSSVLHELYSYGDNAEIKRFWAEACGNGYKYLFIRDMVSNISSKKDANTEDVRKVYSRTDLKEKIHDFEEIWGSIHKQRNLIHFLLKYRYDLNWSREVKENYIPLSSEQIIQQLYGYEIIYREEYTLPFIKQQVKKDFDINLNEVTHIKLIAKKT